MTGDESSGGCSRCRECGSRWPPTFEAVLRTVDDGCPRCNGVFSDAVS